jgi:hypothetical protein
MSTTSEILSAFFFSGMISGRGEEAIAALAGFDDGAGVQ